MRKTHKSSAKDKKAEKSGSKKGSAGFQTMGFSWQILKSIINSGYKQPTPIQRKAIPEILNGKDVVAMARTGSGKTAAFLLPMFQRLHEKLNAKGAKPGPKALVMSPTRELALQTFKFAKQFGKYSDFKVAVILGGDKIEDQFETMHENPDIIIATPGRFLHICVEMNYKLSTVEYVVFDEADRLFEMGFKEQLNEILHKLPSENRQTLLFSATLPQSLVEFARAGLQNPVLIRLDTESKLSDKLKLAFFQCRCEDKLAILLYLLNNHIKPVKNPQLELPPTVEKKDEDAAEEEKENGVEAAAPLLSQTLIFVATKHHVEFLKDLLEQLGYSVAYAYSSLDQTARLINIAKFQNKKTSIMIVTDVAARGIDIPKLDNVINFNFPPKAKLFVHRVGRVARAGQTGTSYSLVSADEVPYMHELHEFLSKPIRFASDEMSPEDWNEVYGSVPQAIIDIEKDSVEHLVASKAELTSAFQVQENAYKQYLKSRPLASAFSVKTAKNMRIMHPVLAVHPFFRTNKDLKASFDSQASLLDKLKSYTTKTTVFEMHKTAAHQAGALVMRNKREKHDRVVEKYKSKENLEEKISLFQKNMYSVQSDAFKDENGEDAAAAEDDDDDGDEADENVFVNQFNDQELVVKISNNDDDGAKLSKKAARRKQAKEIIDKEHFIPYKPKNFQQERALEINSNFNREVSNAAMDLVGDDETEIRRNMQKTKWDRKKKKYVSVQSTMDQSKKIKTESGNFIKASYKSDLYAKWLKRNKSGERDDDADGGDDDEAGGNDYRKKKKFFGSTSLEKNYFGSHKFKSNGKPGVRRFAGQGEGRHARRHKDEEASTGSKRKMNFGDRNMAKRFKSSSKEKPAHGGGGGGRKRPASTGLRNKDQIMKERNRKEKIKSFQSRKKTGAPRNEAKKYRPKMRR